MIFACFLPVMLKLAGVCVTAFVFFWGVFWQICDTPAASLEMIFFLEAERSETQTHPMPQDPSEVIQEKKQFTFP